MTLKVNTNIFHVFTIGIEHNLKDDDQDAHISLSCAVHLLNYLLFFVLFSGVNSNLLGCFSSALLATINCRCGSLELYAAVELTITAKVVSQPSLTQI